MRARHGPAFSRPMIQPALWAVEQAFRLVDLCAKSFQRAARQLANIRLVRAKTARTRRRERAKVVRGVRVA